jgi:hypothetical protein
MSLLGRLRLMIQGPKPGFVVCALCKTERRKSETRQFQVPGSLELNGGVYFCSHTCWDQRGRIIGSKLGKECLYWEQGNCTAGAQHTPCTLKAGRYQDCYIYKMHRR